MPNYELTENGLTTHTSAIKLMCTDDITHVNGMARGWSEVNEYMREDWSKIICSTWAEVRIPYALIKSAIAPVEGEAYVHFVDDKKYDHVGLSIITPEENRPSKRKYNPRVLVMCQTHGDLRELLTATERWG